MADAATPLVSIVIPVYNQEIRYLNEALMSALGQNYPAIEVIVSDNHSTNDAPAYLQTVDNPRLRVIKPPVFMPMVQHFQFAADQATGDFILFLCSDDWLYADCVSTLMPHLVVDPQIVVSYGEIESINNDDLKDIKSYYNRKPTGRRSAKTSLNELLRSRPIFGWIPGGIMRKSAYWKVRDVLSGQYSFSFDFALLFRLHEIGDIYYVDKSVAKFRFWTPKAGKQGGDRMAESIRDVGNLCTLLQATPALVAYLTNGLTDVKAWRSYQAKRWVMNLLLGLASGNVSGERFEVGVKALEQHLSLSSGASGLLRSLAGNPLGYVTKPCIRLAYNAYLQVQKRTQLSI